MKIVDRPITWRTVWLFAIGLNVFAVVVLAAACHEDRRIECHRIGGILVDGNICIRKDAVLEVK